MSYRSCNFSIATRTVKVLFTVIAVFVFLSSSAAAEGLSYGSFKLNTLLFTKINNAFRVYDFVFPTLVRFSIINDKDSAKTKIIKTVKFINFYSTPGRYTRYKGLGSGGPWWKNGSLMLSSGNLLCSEQASLATLILKTDFKYFALRDVTHHTFFEAFNNNHWSILDPMFDNRIRNKEGRIVSFDDIQAYLKGEKGALKLPKHISARTKFYLGLFRKETYKPIRMAFGQHIVFPSENLNLFVGMGINEFLYLLKSHNLGLNSKVSYPYLVYVRNNIIKILQNTPQKRRKTLIYKIQDYFFEKMALESMKGWLPPQLDSIYTARNYQFLGRYTYALNIFNSLKQTRQILFYTAQIYFKTKNRKKFNNLARRLKTNIYYRYMYWLLNKQYLLKSDPKTFDNFKYRLVDYDRILVKYGKLILP